MFSFASGVSVAVTMSIVVGMCLRSCATEPTVIGRWRRSGDTCESATSNCHGDNVDGSGTVERTLVVFSSKEDVDDDEIIAFGMLSCFVVCSRWERRRPCECVSSGVEHETVIAESISASIKHSNGSQDDDGDDNDKDVACLDEEEEEEVEEAACFLVLGSDENIISS